MGCASSSSSTVRSPACGSTSSRGSTRPGVRVIRQLSVIVAANIIEDMLGRSDVPLTLAFACPPPEAELLASVRSLASKLQAAQNEGGSPGAGQVDVELLSAWLPGAPATFDELSNITVEISQGKARSESVATLKRGLHTIKGECGVIGLSLAQQICHQIEDAVVDGTVAIDAGVAIGHSRLGPLLNRGRRPARTRLEAGCSRRARVSGRPCGPSRPPPETW